MIELIEGLPKNVVGIFVKGRVTQQECRDILRPAVANSLKRNEKIRLYYELCSRFPGAAWDELDLGSEQASRCERIAIVTDIAWVRLTVKALRFLIPGEIRVFDTIEAPEGRAWITSRSVSPAAVVEAMPVRSRAARARAHPASRRGDGRSRITKGGSIRTNRPAPRSPVVYRQGLFAAPQLPEEALAAASSASDPRDAAVLTFAG